MGAWLDHKMAQFGSWSYQPAPAISPSWRDVTVNAPTRQERTGVVLKFLGHGTLPGDMRASLAPGASQRHGVSLGHLLDAGGWEALSSFQKDF